MYWISANSVDGRVDALDVVVDDATTVEEFDARQQEAEPFTGFHLVDFNGNKGWIVGPRGDECMVAL